MAKKKSKTQKYKKNLKKKQTKMIQSLNKEQNSTEKSKIQVESSNNKKESVSKNKPSNASLSQSNKKRKKVITSNNQSNKNDVKKQVVNKDKVKYNVALTEPSIIKKNATAKKLESSKKETNKKNINKEKSNLLNSISNIFTNLKENLTRKKGKNQVAKQEKQFSSSAKVPAMPKKKNIFFRLLYEITHNIHIVFNATLIVFFLVLVVALIRIEALSTGKILYICGIVLFLSLIALSYTKYTSGKIFTILLCIGMGFAIYQMQYTYDFVRNLASNLYEYKPYYVVTFDNGVNKSIYTINKKSVGLLKENCVNVERILNTKLDEVNYMEYNDMNQLFEDFYDSKFRAVLVNENQLKYLQNNIQGNKDVKILYEFKVNSKK